MSVPSSTKSVNNGDIVRVVYLPKTMSHFNKMTGIVCKKKGNSFFIKEIDEKGNAIPHSEVGWYHIENVEVVISKKDRDMCNNERKPHVHAEVIKAWADGVPVQYRRYDGTWRDVTAAYPSWDSDWGYRIKPEPTDLEKYGVEVGDVWRTKGGSYKIVGRKVGRDVYGAELDREILYTLLFRRGVVNKL